ncbi:MAG: hypothetical protein ABSH41_19615 [Syntrophobacteraceae bacterium]
MKQLTVTVGRRLHGEQRFHGRDGKDSFESDSTTLHGNMARACQEGSFVYDLADDGV